MDRKGQVFSEKSSTVDAFKTNINRRCATKTRNHYTSSQIFIFSSDPDSPSRAEPKNREWLLWLVVNIPGFDVKSGDTIVDYMRPDAGKGTGKNLLK